MASSLGCSTHTGESRHRPDSSGAAVSLFTCGWLAAAGEHVCAGAIVSRRRCYRCQRRRHSVLHATPHAGHLQPGVLQSTEPFEREGALLNYGRQDNALPLQTVQPRPQPWQCRLTLPCLSQPPCLVHPLASHTPRRVHPSPLEHPSLLALVASYTPLPGAAAAHGRHCAADRRGAGKRGARPVQLV